MEPVPGKSRRITVYAITFEFLQYPALNALAPERLRIMTVTSTPIDENFDGTPDLQRIRFRVPLGPSETVSGVSVVLIFDYSLELYSRLHMECMAFADLQASGPTARLAIDADLALHQRSPLHYRNDDTRFNEPIL